MALEAHLGWSFGVLVCWCVGVLVCWCVGVVRNYAPGGGVLRQRRVSDMG